MPPRIYSIPLAVPGKLAIMARPRAGDWLAEEIADMKAEGLRTLVSLLTDDEIAELNLRDEPAACAEAEMEFLQFPIRDRQTPILSGAYADFARRLEARLVEGSGVGIHCRMGIGRSSLVAASVMILRGVPAAEALAAISAARGKPVPDTPDQVAWLGEFEAKWLGRRDCD